METNHMKLTRRKFMTASVASLASTSVLGANLNTQNGKLIHNVYFWLNNPDSAEDRKALINGLKTLKEIPSVKSLHIGLPANTDKRDVVDNSFSVSEIMYFDDLAGQNEYQAHPIHKAFVEEYANLWSKVVVHDSVLV